MATADRIKSGKELTLTRTFNAPRELVFRAWTDCDYVTQWWGPNDFTNPACELDVRPGGAIRIDMRGPDGVVYPNTGVYEEVAPPERLVFSTALVDEEGNTLLRDITTVSLAGLNGQTKLTLNARVVEAVPEMAGALDGMEEGWSQSLDRLAASLAQPQQPMPDPAVRRLDVLVGTWEVSGPEVRGQIRFEWLEGGHYLVQHFNLNYAGHEIKGIEIIGRERKFGADAPGQDITSHSYDNEGNSLDYVYELEGDTLTIWGGYVGSPAYFRGRFSEDRNTFSGRWVWPNPDGTTGGYEATGIRVRGATTDRPEGAGKSAGYEHAMTGIEQLSTGRQIQRQKIAPFLWFDNQAEEAMMLYTSIFKNSKVLGVTRYGEAGPGPKGSVMTASFELEGQQFTALNGGPLFKFTEAISFVVDCKSQEEVDELWEKLSEGGEKGQCGWLKDRFGVSWQIVPTALGEMMSDPDPEKARRVTEAMLKMQKIDMQALRRAYEQG